MRALTLWQPHATLMALGKKPWETRSWKAPALLLGHPLAIHAGKRLDKQAMKDAKVQRGLGKLSEEPRWLPYGGIIAVVLVVDCRPTEESDRRRSWGARLRPEDFGDFSHGRYAWETKLLLKCTPHIVCRGYQGLWNVPANIAEVLQEELDSDRGRKRLKKVTSF